MVIHTAIAMLCLALTTASVAQTSTDQPASNHSTTVPRPPDQIRVLSYNIHHGAGVDSKIDLERIAKVIRSVDPDIVMLQEVDQNVRRSKGVDQAARLAELTGLSAVFGGNIDLQGGKYGNAILTRLPLIEYRNHSLPNVDDGEQRGALDATVWFLGMPLRVICTHFDHRRDPRERIASAQQLNSLANTNDMPAVLAGDINATRSSPVLKTLEKEWIIAGPEIPTIPVANPTRQIDFVLFRSPRWKVIETRVLNESVASDHRPIFSVLHWGGNQEDKSQRSVLRRDILAIPHGENRGQIARSTSEWREKANAIRWGVETVMGRLPESTDRKPPSYQILGEVDCGTYVRKKILYRSEPDCETPAYLCVPKSLPTDGSRQVPAVLCLHPTDNRVGHDVVVGLGGKPNRQYASELAERGFVTLSPSYPLLAGYQPDIQRLGWKSGTLKAVWDNIRGVDLLQSLPYVRDSDIAAIGHSLGGHNAVFTAVHDHRIRAVISSCGLDRFSDYYNGDSTKWLPGKGWTQTRYMPRLANYRGQLGSIPFDFDELIALLAPRHVMIVAPEHDGNFRVDSVRELTSESRKVFSLHDQSERLIVQHPDCDHDFPESMRRAAYEMLESVFAPIE